MSEQSQYQKVNIEDVISKIRKLENFEIINYEDDKVVLAPYRGIVKIGQDEELKKYLREAKRRKPRSKPKDKQIRLVEDIARRLLNDKIKFKVIFEGKDIILRFDIDHFIKITEKEVKIAGFRDEREDPINRIYDIVSKYGKVLFLKAVK